MNPLFLIFLLILLTGCQSIPSSDFDVKAQISVLQQANKFDSALDIIDHHETPELFAIERVSVLKAREKYIEIQVDQINAALEAEEWYRARININEALKYTPTSEQLLLLKADTEQREDAYINEKLALQSLAEGQYLINSMPTLEAITESAPDKLKYRRELGRMQQRSEQLAKTLVQYAQVNYENQNYQTSQDALMIAKQLDPDTSAPKLEMYLTEYWQRKKEQDNKIAEKNKLEAIQLLERQLKNALENSDLVSAQELMARLWDIDAKNPIRFEQQRNLNEALANMIEIGLRRGDQLYNDGNILEALNVWNELLPVQKGHVGLNERISRAKRFIANLERLKTESVPES